MTTGAVGRDMDHSWAQELSDEQLRERRAYAADAGLVSLHRALTREMERRARLEGLEPG
jgi:hypothetical protein